MLLVFATPVLAQDAPAADGEVLLELKRVGPAPTVSTEDEQTPTDAEQPTETVAVDWPGALRLTIDVDTSGYVTS